MKISRGKSTGSGQRLSGVSGKKTDPQAGQKSDQDRVDGTEPAIGVSLSDTSQLVSAAKASLAQLPDVRMEKVSDLKLSVDDGSYHVESQVVAKRMVDEALRESARFIDKPRPGDKDGDTPSGGTDRTIDQ